MVFEVEVAVELEVELVGVRVECVAVGCVEDGAAVESVVGKVVDVMSAAAAEKWPAKYKLNLRAESTLVDKVAACSEI